MMENADGATDSLASYDPKTPILVFRGISTAHGLGTTPAWGRLTPNFVTYYVTKSEMKEGHDSILSGW